MRRKKITIGLFGYGCVGKGLYEVLQKTVALNLTIKKVCIKQHDKARTIDSSYFTTDKNELLNDPEIDIIVELIDDSEAAFDIVREGLKKGKAVVSANKKMIAENFTELLELQETTGMPLLYEAACCASIPIIRNLEEYYDNDLLQSIEGIVNGSTNYILDQTSRRSITYQQALAEAVEKGYAESDHRLDTDGYDAKYKLVLLLGHAFGLIVKPEKIFNLGINNIGKRELDYAREKGLKIKLLAHASKNEDDSITSFVCPSFVESENKLYSVDEVYNGLSIKSSFSDRQFFEGKGAGAYATASAVISDLSALSYSYRYEYRKINSKVELRSESQIFLKVFCRYTDEERNLKIYFNKVEESLATNREGYIIGLISLANIRKALLIKPDTSFVLFGTAPKKRQTAVFDLALLESKEF